MQFKNKSIRLYLAVLAALGWFALSTQFYLIIVNRTASIPETFVRYFSYFTILTNFIVAICSTVLALGKDAKLYRFFSGQQTLAGITVYIVMVGIVYNVVLRKLWNPTGLQKIVDELLHTMIPLMFLFFWLVVVPKKNLTFGGINSWLLYPAAYVILVLIRGGISGFYPYPFFDYSLLGSRKLLINISFLIIVFITFSVLFVSIGKLVGLFSKKI